MIKNYFKSAWHNLSRNKTFTLLNIAGLCHWCNGLFLFMTVWLQRQLSFLIIFSPKWGRYLSGIQYV